MSELLQFAVLIITAFVTFFLWTVFVLRHPRVNTTVLYAILLSVGCKVTILVSASALALLLQLTQ